MIGIYKITNHINGKSYIGQSIHIHRRCQEHCKPCTQSVISSAIKKYGKDNFSFEVLEECRMEDLDDRERYWIKHFGTITPNGYNIAEDTESAHTTYHFFDKDTLLSIVDDIKNTTLSLVYIASKYEVDKSTISRINSGQTHRIEGETYPLRNTYSGKKIEFLCVDCGRPISHGSKRCLECENKARKQDIPISRDRLKLLIRTTPFTKIGREFGVSDNAIRKWCKKVNLPTKVSEIKKLTDEEWSLL